MMNVLKINFFPRQHFFIYFGSNCKDAKYCDHSAGLKPHSHLAQFLKALLSFKLEGKASE